MKNLLFLLVLGLAVPAGAEVISTVSFNPSRMGSYDYLKVSKEATFKGGLVTGTDGTTGTMNIQSKSGSTLSMQISDNQNYYKIPKVEGDSGSAVDMTGTTFRGGSINTSVGAYSASNAYSLGSLLPTVEIAGGHLTMDNDSYVHEIKWDEVNKTGLQHYTDNFNAGTLTITGKNGGDIELSKDLNIDGETKGFHLAGVDIPYPQGHMCEGSTCGTTKPYQSLCWVQRCTKDGQVAWVLSLVNDSCPTAKASIACGGSGSNGEGNNYLLTKQRTTFMSYNECNNFIRFNPSCESLGYKAGDCLNGHEGGNKLCWIEAETNCVPGNANSDLTVLNGNYSESCITD